MSVCIYIYIYMYTHVYTLLLESSFMYYIVLKKVSDKMYVKLMYRRAPTAITVNFNLIRVATHHIAAYLSYLALIDASYLALLGMSNSSVESRISGYLLLCRTSYFLVSPSRSSISSRTSSCDISYLAASRISW